jgi:hypothetical protein
MNKIESTKDLDADAEKALDAAVRRVQEDLGLTT